MINFLKTVALLLACTITFNLQAQNTNPEEAAIKAFWQNVWQSFDAGNSEAMWAAYTDDAAEIGPDGSLTTGKAALRASWDAFMKMMDAAPKFTYANPSVRILTADVALITWDSEADIRMGGQQIGGKTKGMAVLHKIKGHWFIEFDSLTPVMQMPPAGDTQH